ncbi:MAG: PIN domain-containing protein [Bdellovibrionaceae bacterium]|nr:PIN domain-containing protein [Pseudobdellovibrionaceae bacterium]
MLPHLADAHGLPTHRHPSSIFARPLSPEAAWNNIIHLLRLPRVMVLTETDAFAATYAKATQGKAIRGNLVPDAHLAALLQLHGVKRLYSTDSDFRKFEFLEVIHPFD